MSKVVGADYKSEPHNYGIAKDCGRILLQFVLVPSFVYADVAQSPEPVLKLDDYIVQAWHFENSTLDIPADVVRIERETIDRSLAVSVPDLLETEANLIVSNVSGFTNVSIRGFGEGSGLRSLILVDGQPLSPADMGRINWEQIPLESIESVEVLRGGHNVLYGDKALSGVIKIETRRSTEARLDLEGRRGSFGFRQASISGAIGGEVWGISGGLFEQVSEGYRENSDSDTRSASVNTWFDFENGDQVDLRMAAGEIDLVYPGGLDEATYRTDPRASDNIGDQGSENSYAALTGRARGEREWGSWEVLSGFDRNDVEWSFGEGSYGDNLQSGYSLKPRIRIERAEWLLILGSDLLYDELEFISYRDEARTIVPSEAELSESRLSPYLLFEYSISDRLTLSTGLRHEWIRYNAENTVYVSDQIEPIIETNRGQQPNPNFKSPPDIDPLESYDETIREDGYSAEISANLRLTDELSIWIGYDRAYRYPVFDERAAYQSFPLAEPIARDLEAEEGDQFDLGVKWIDGSHELYFTIFLLKMENEIIFDPAFGIDDPNTPGNGINRNLGPVDRYGGEFSYNFKREMWGLSCALSFVETEMKEGVEDNQAGQEVPLVPSIVTTSRIWVKPWDQLRLTLVHRYVDERYQGSDFANNSIQIESY
ncbi:MAG: TonB-dependent receptor, partial [Verrucomicrobiota bacterium]